MGARRCQASRLERTQPVCGAPPPCSVHPRAVLRVDSPYRLREVALSPLSGSWGVLLCCTDTGSNGRCVPVCFAVGNRRMRTARDTTRARSSLTKSLYADGLSGKPAIANLLQDCKGRFETRQFARCRTACPGMASVAIESTGAWSACVHVIGLALSAFRSGPHHHPWPPVPRACCRPSPGPR